MNNDTNPWYYDEENHGYWLKSSDYEFVARLIRLSHEACDAGIACWLEDNLLYSDLPF